MSSPICIELKRSPDLQSMHTPPAAEAGLESEKFTECDVGDGRNAGAIGTHANSYQSGCRALCLPMASCRQPEGAANSVNRRFLAAHAKRPPVGTHLTWRVESQAQEQVEKLKRKAACAFRSAGSLKWHPCPTKVGYSARLGAPSAPSLTAALRQASVAGRPIELPPVHRTQRSEIMHQYRIYTFREDGHFSTVRRIECTDQKQAVQEAQQLVEGEDSELWQGEHLIARFTDLQKPQSRLAPAAGLITVADK